MPIHKTRAAILLATTGLLWYLALNLFFVFSQAQRILANPDYQSTKFLNVFMSIEPLPRMATDPWLVFKGLFVVGVLLAIAFLYVNQLMKGRWWQKGLKFGMLHWLMMTPWFEFYLPYNVMHEPFLLVLLEGVLWLGVCLTVGLGMSAIYNFGNKS